MQPAKIHQTLTILYGAFVASSFVYLIVAVFLKTAEWKPILPQHANLLFVLFLAVSVVIAAMVLQQRKALSVEVADVQRNPGELRQRLLSRTMLWFALSEVPAILGLFFFMLTGSLGGMLTLLAISLVAFTVVRLPRKTIEDLEARSSAPK